MMSDVAPPVPGRPFRFVPAPTTTALPAPPTLTGRTIPASRISASRPLPKLPVIDVTPLNVWLTPKAVILTEPPPALLISYVSSVVVWLTLRLEAREPTFSVRTPPVWRREVGRRDDVRQRARERERRDRDGEARQLADGLRHPAVDEAHDVVAEIVERPGRPAADRRGDAADDAPDLLDEGADAADVQVQRDGLAERPRRRARDRQAAEAHPFDLGAQAAADVEGELARCPDRTRRPRSRCR